ncbi:DUF4363 family protein [Camelliibacillus cellulosilyticus]|uniref:DUF4363 family protein n=1 Tax=Camelliibacillus cellulosilyticus TaxID=2174486 RepID=A0ABV9GLM2_9BACL
MKVLTWVMCLALGGWLLLSPQTSVDAKGGARVMTQLNNVEENIRHKHWHQALEQSECLKQTFNKNRWKYQILSSENEYEGATKELARLKAAISIKDQPSSLLIAAELKEIFHQIHQY